MAKKFDKALLRRVRNDIEINVLIEHILQMEWRIRENHFRFLCPVCGEFNTATNPTTNLARCFCCQKNFNPIDLVMIYRRYAFTDAVRFLLLYLQPQTRAKIVPRQKSKAREQPENDGGVMKSRDPLSSVPGISVSDHLVRLRKTLEEKLARSKILTENKLAAKRRRYTVVKK